MKHVLVIALLFVAVCFLSPDLVYSQTGKTVSYTGKVTALDANGKAIVMDFGHGKEMMTAGVVVDSATKLSVKGKVVPIANLLREIQVGDTVTLNYVKADDCYAKQIIKK